MLLSDVVHHTITTSHSFEYAGGTANVETASFQWRTPLLIAFVSHYGIEIMGN